MTEGTNSSVFGSLAKYVGGKLLTAILVVAVGLTCYYFYKNPDKLETLWATTKAALLWIGFVTLLPWALFFLPGVVLRADSNAAAVLLLVGYLILDMLMALWLADWHISGTLTWAVVILGFLAAGIYNFVVCDFLAEWADESSL